MLNFDQYWINPRSIKLHKQLISFGVGKQFEEHLQGRMRELQRIQCLQVLPLSVTCINVLQNNLIKKKVQLTCIFLVFSL